MKYIVEWDYEQRCSGNSRMYWRKPKHRKEEFNDKKSANEYKNELEELKDDNWMRVSNIKMKEEK